MSPARELLPRFLLERLEQGKPSGSVDAAAIYLDVAGFTAMTEALAEHGPHGAEIVADIIQAAWSPIVESVHAWGGFVATFSGDAVLALFAGERRHDQALAAAHEIASGVRSIGERTTPYGTFSVAVKIGVGSGAAEWEILQSRDGHRRTFVFRGSAPERAVAAELEAGPGDLIVHPSMSPSPTGGPVPRAAPIVPGREHPLAAEFIPREVLESDGPGEFRPIVPLFAAIEAERLAPVLDDVFALQDRYGGILLAVEAGDKGGMLLLVWGAPVGFAGDADRAMSFAVALRRRHAEVRIGAAYGTAFAGFVGPPVRQTYTIYSSQVNLAARLATAAAPGEVLLSPALARRVEGGRELRPMGALRMKGVAEPVVPHAVTDVEATPQRRRGFVGRESELSALEAFLEPLRRGSGAGAALITGEAGIGKSSLLTEARKRATAAGQVRWLSMSADPVWRGALHPLAALAAGVLEQAAHQDEATNRAHFAVVLERLGLEKHRAFLGALVGLHWTGSEWDSAGPEVRHRRIVSALIDLFAALSDDGLVVVLEDAHWADLETLAMLPELLKALAGRRFALIVSSRPGEGDVEVVVGNGTPALSLRLGALDREELRRMAAETLGAPVSRTSAAWLSERTAGNPFFAEQLLLHLRERNLLVQTAEGLDAEGVDRVVPPTVGEVVVARLDNLAADVRRVVTTAAVLGPRLELSELRHMLAAAPGEDALSSAVSTAAARGFWSSDGRIVEFSHGLVRDAAYGTLLVATRRTLHGDAAHAIAELYEDQLGPHLHRLAGHHAEALALTEAMTCERAAADRALGLGAYREAGEYAANGLALAGAVEDGPDRRRQELGLWLGLGAARMITHGQGALETKEAYDRAAALSADATDTREGFRALFGLRTFYLFAGDHATSLRMAERSLQVAEAIGEPELLVQARLMVGNARFWVGDLEAAERHLAGLTEGEPGNLHASHLSSFAQNPRFTALFPAAMARSLRGDVNGARTMAEEGLAAARAVGHRFSEAVVLQVLGFLHCRDGEAEAALATGQELVELAGQEGFPVYSEIGSLIVGWARARLGEVDAGLELVNVTAARMRAGGTKVASTLIGALVADAHLTAGRPEGGLQATEAALADARARTELAFVGELERLRTELIRQQTTKGLVRG